MALTLDLLVKESKKPPILSKNEFENLKRSLKRKKGRLVREVFDKFDIKLYRDHYYFKEFFLFR